MPISSGMFFAAGAVPIEQQIDRPCGEREPEMDVSSAYAMAGQPRQDGVHHVERESPQTHEGEFERLGHAGQKRGSARRRQDADRDLALTAVPPHESSPARQRANRHHDRIETRREAPGTRVTRCKRPIPRHRPTTPERIAAVDEPRTNSRCGCSPNGYQHAVGESMDEGTQRRQLPDETAQARQAGVENRMK